VVALASLSGAKALARQGSWDAAIVYAEVCRTPQGHDGRWIDRFCEVVCDQEWSGRRAYHRYGLKAAVGPTYLAIFRKTIKRYPERDRRQVLLDLIDTRGDRSKWFAAAKEAGFLDVALAGAWNFAADPATHVRAARDFAAKEPKFAAGIGVVALGRLLNGGGYDPEVSLVREAFGHLTDAASRIGASDWAKERVRALVDGPCHTSRKHFQCVLPYAWRVVVRSQLGIETGYGTGTAACPVFEHLGEVSEFMRLGQHHARFGQSSKSRLGRRVLRPSHRQAQLGG
jgi:hypothetical protein